MTALAKLAGLRCTFRGCPETPVKQLTPSGCSTPWYGCTEHYPPMLDALHIGLSGATNGTGWVKVVNLTIGHDDDQGATI